uniref:phosphatidate phosphatase n=1 Tax=Terrapene triunguis TaxID=2587831 RepID=A0A674J9H8_9SAUR
MNYVGQLAETVLITVKELYKGLNPATLTGCIDIIVVRQPDGSFRCSPFHVRFGKLGVLRSREKVVDIEINGEPVDLHMKLGDNGEAFFVQESEENEEMIPSCLCTSPIPLEESPDLEAKPSQASTVSQLSLLGEPEASGSDMTSLRKKRRRRKKLKPKGAADSTSEEQEGTDSEWTLEEKPLVPVEVPGATVIQMWMGAVDVERVLLDFLVLLCSLTPSRPSSPKSDSELEIKPSEPSLLGAEPRMQWTWGRLPQVGKGEGMEKTISKQILLFGKTGWGEISFLTTCRWAAGAWSSERTWLSQQGAQEQSAGEAVEGEENVVKNQQALELDPSCARAAPAPRQAGSERMEPSDSPGTRPESPRRQGSTKRSPHLGPSDIYLEDLPNLDEEQVALYFPKSDVEPGSKSWTDPSSPGHTQLLAGPTVDGGTDNLSDPTHDLTHPIALSLCGGLGDSREILHKKFVEHIISYQEFAENPEVLDDPNLVIQIHKKYYNWAVAAPMILSLQAFQKNVPKSTIDRLVKEKMPKKSGRWWFSWRRRDLTAEEVCVRETASFLSLSQFPRGCRRKMDPSSSDESISPVSSPDATVQKFLPTYKKSLRLSSDQIRLNLQDGPNEVVFSVTTQYQGTCRCEATIYLWNWDDKVVISDIDGTITKSDALGHILPQLGKDWTHQGIAKLFHKIHMNGYKFLYCSSRAIGMAHITKGYLKWVKDQGCALPRGPILLAPSSLFSAFHREVIEKKPEVFKIACLTDIRNLFGSMGQPFHAAFGNRVHDVDAYKQVGLSESHIFTVNPKGELIRELTKNQKSTYERLTELVELIFPPVGQGVSVALLWPEYSQFSYWRAPLPLIDIEDLA